MSQSPDILIVEDEKIIRNILFEFVKENGYQVNAVDCAEEAFFMIQKNNYKLVVLDIHLPGIDGIELLEKIKIYDEKIAVIMMTGYSVERAREVLKSRKVEGVLDKPFHPSELLPYLEKYLSPRS